MQASVSKDRDKYIGGSDIPIIMGISPFKKRYDLLLEKSGLKENDFTGNKFTEYGNIMESKIRDFINNDEFYKTQYHGDFVEDKKIIGNIRCHVDGYNEKKILEIKTTSQIHENVDDYNVYLVQLLFYMQNYKIDKGVLAVYERPEEIDGNYDENFDETRLKTYEINIKDYEYLLNQINAAVVLFLEDLNKLKENPLLTEVELLPIDLARLSSEVVILETELAKMKEIEDRYKAAKEELKVGMERVGLNKWETPNGTKITLVEDSPDKEVEIESYDEEKFIKENSELHEQYNLKLAEYKITKKEIKKGKKGYVRITFPKER